MARPVHFAHATDGASWQALTAAPKAAEHSSALAAIEGKIKAGGDLNPHLSTRVAEPLRPDLPASPHKRSDRDLLLADWGVHHLHLSTEVRSDGSVKRGRDVLFAVFMPEDAYLIGIYDHQPHANWAAEEIFGVMVREWPQAELAIEIGGVSLAQKPSDQDRQQLRQGGVQSMMEIDGKVYIPRRFGLTTAGTPIYITRQVNQVMWDLRDAREGLEERLRQVEGVPAGAYWAPALHCPQPGFEEYCGFATGTTFYAVARIC